MHALETDRLKLARQQAADAEHAFNVHRMNCSDCSRAVRENDPWAYCEPGFQLAKLAKRAGHALDNAKLARDQAAMPQEETLF
jgi:hypothetical protein